MRDRLKFGVAITVLGAVLWGLMGTCSQYLTNIRGIDVSFLVVSRLTISGIILSAFTAVKNRDSLRIFKDKKDTLLLIAFALGGLLFCQFSYSKAIYYTNAATATVLQYLGTIFIAIYVCVKETRLPRKFEVVSIFLAIFGTFILSTRFNLKVMAISPIGLFWGIAAAVGLSTYSTMPHGLIKKYGAIAVTGIGMLIGGIFLLFATRVWNIEVEFDLPMIVAFFIVVIPGTAVAFVAFLKGVNIVGPMRGSILATIEPIASLFFSWILLGQKVVPVDLLGIGVVLSAVLIQSIFSNKVNRKNN